MPPKLPPPSTKKSNSGNALFNGMVRKNGVNRQVASDVLYWARRNGIDPIYALSVMLAESHANPHVHDSSAGAIGVMQVMPGMHKIPWGNGGVASAQWLRSYANNIRLGMFILAQAVHQVGYSKAYSGVRGVSYNYGGGTPYAQYTPKGYVYGEKSVGTGAGTAPEASAANSVATTQATQQAKADAGLLFEQRFPEISSIWEAYTGKPATRAQAMGVYNAGWSNYHLELQLSKGKSFVGSPVWKQNAPSYMDTFHQIYGANAKPDRQLVAYGIIHNLTASGFADLLRQRKDYVKSNEFKTSQSQLDAVYRKIYGAPDDQGSNVIKTAVLNGWNADEFAKYLRAQPEYSGSQEYQSNTMGVLDSLGMLTGAGGATLHPGGPAPLQGQPQVNAPPPDKRVKGKAGVGVQGPAFTPGIG